MQTNNEIASRLNHKLPQRMTLKEKLIFYLIVCLFVVAIVLFSVFPVIWAISLILLIKGNIPLGTKGVLPAKVSRILGILGLSWAVIMFSFGLFDVTENIDDAITVIHAVIFYLSLVTALIFFKRPKPVN